MPPGEPERYGDVTLFIQPGDPDPDDWTLGLWGQQRTVQMPYGTMQTALCRPSEIGLTGFDHLFSSDPLPMARGISRDDAERLRAALRSRAAAADERGGGDPTAG